MSPPEDGAAGGEEDLENSEGRPSEGGNETHRADEVAEFPAEVNATSFLKDI